MTDRINLIRLWLRGYIAAKRGRNPKLIGDGFTDNGPIMRGFKRGGGGIIRLAAGTYRLDRTSPIGSNTTIVGKPDE